jgi:hypothetical protein
VLFIKIVTTVRQQCDNSVTTFGIGPGGGEYMCFTDNKCKKDAQHDVTVMVKHRSRGGQTREESSEQSR